MNEQSSSHKQLLQELQRLRHRVAELEAAEAERQKDDATLQAAVESTAHTGEAFFHWLVRHLCSTLAIQYAFVGELVGEAKDQIRTLAFWANGDLGENFQYELAGTPCETVIGQQLQHYPRAVAELFPHDADLKTLQVECYLGTPLFSATGQPLGILVVMDTKPEGTTPLAESALLRILASRAGAEIERQQAEDERRRLAALVEASGDFIGLATLDGHVQYVNAAGKKLVGLDEEADVTQTTTLDYVPPDDLRELQEEIMPVITQHGQWRGEARFKDFQTGLPIPVEVKSFLVRDLQTRQPIGLAMVSHDLTERQQAEEALRTSEERFRRAIIDAPIPIMIHADDGTVLQISQQWTALTGYSLEDIPTLAEWTGKAYGEQNAAMQADIRRLYQGDHVADREAAVTTKSGATRVWSFSSSVLGVLSDGRRVSISTALDVTASKQAEAWRQQLLETTQDAFLTIDRGGHIRQFNRAAEQIFGYPCADVVGQKVNMLMPELYASEHDGYIERYERTREPRAIGQIRTVSAKRKNGEVFPIELSVTEVAADGDTRYGAFIRDISEKVRLQVQLVERERLAAIGTTTATLAHEIGNPLNGMTLNVQLMQRRLAKAGEGLDTRFTGYVSNMQREINRLTNLLQEFRSVSRRQTFTFQPLDLSAVIHELLAAETPHYTERGVQVEHLVPDDLPQVQADADKLKQVFLNLCKNAVEAMPAGGTLTLRAHYEEEHVHIEVTDTGEGIPDGVNIFELFATTKAEGTGLGLPVVQQIVTAHGGTLSYTSTPGQGTTFTVVLPLNPPRATP